MVSLQLMLEMIISVTQLAVAMLAFSIEMTPVGRCWLWAFERMLLPITLRGSTSSCDEGVQRSTQQ